MSWSKKYEVQHEKLLAAERHRVMIESLGAACHHLGQPATVISAYLQMMKRKERDPELQDMISKCILAANSMADILKQLMHVSQYRTEPYLASNGNDDCHHDETILKI